jgi:hypothetical protein
VASLPIVTDIQYGTLYDGTLQTFALMKIERSKKNAQKKLNKSILAQTV